MKLFGLMIVVVMVGCGKKKTPEPQKKAEASSLPELKQTPSKGAKELKAEPKEPPTKAARELNPADAVGRYGADFAALTFRFILLENGVVQNYLNGKKEPEDSKWKIQGAEVHIQRGKSDRDVFVYRIEPNGDFTLFARIRNGKREGFQNQTYKKIKPETKETPSKAIAPLGRDK